MNQLENLLSRIEQVMDRYDAEHDTAPGLPRVTHTDMVILETLKEIIYYLQANEQDSELEEFLKLWNIQ